MTPEFLFLGQHPGSSMWLEHHVKYYNIKGMEEKMSVRPG